MKKITFSLCSLILILSFLTPIAASAKYTPNVSVKSNIALLVSLDNDTVVYSKNADLQTAPASLTKITTAILAIENTPNLDAEKVTAPADPIYELNGTNSSTADIRVGEVLTMHQLLYCMLMQSANEAANIIAYHIGNGSTQTFVNMMNTFVKRIGCKNTHFVNPHGLDQDGQYTTASDMAIITKYAMKLPVFMEIANTTRFSIPKTNKHVPRTLYNTNYLLDSTQHKYYYEYAKGIKTGTTTNAGHCVISIASKNGYNYLCIILQGQYLDYDNDGAKENGAFIEAKELFKWAFSNLSFKTVADTNQIVDVVKVSLSKKADKVDLVPQKNVTALVPTGLDASGVMLKTIPGTVPKSIDAPIKKGQVIGKARAMYANEEIATVNLVAANDVSRNPLLYIGSTIKKIFSSIWMKIILLIIIILVIIYIIINIMYNQRKKKNRIRLVRDYRRM